MIFRSVSLIFDSAAYSVVVLPEPVGPVTSTIPCGMSSILSKCSAIARGHAEVLGAEHRVAAVEDTQHDRFAVDHRDDRHADVDLAAGDLAA